MTQTDNNKSKISTILKILRKMFLNSPDKSQITLSGECEHCKKEVSIDIVPTSGGYGVLGGALIDLTPDQCYRLLCPVCHTHSMQANPENERSKVKG